MPNLTANQVAWRAHLTDMGTAGDSYDKVNLIDLKLNTAVAAILTFSIAEHPALLGPRLSRAEIELQMKQTGLDAEMRLMDLWRFWASGQRGRQP